MKRLCSTARIPVPRQTIWPGSTHNNPRTWTARWNSQRARTNRCRATWESWIRWGSFTSDAVNMTRPSKSWKTLLICNGSSACPMRRCSKCAGILQRHTGRLVVLPTLKRCHAKAAIESLHEGSHRRCGGFRNAVADRPKLLSAWNRVLPRGVAMVYASAASFRFGGGGQEEGRGLRPGVHRKREQQKAGFGRDVGDNRIGRTRHHY